MALKRKLRCYPCHSKIQILEMFACEKTIANFVSSVNARHKSTQQSHWFPQGVTVSFLWSVTPLTAALTSRHRLPNAGIFHRLGKFYFSSIYLFSEYVHSVQAVKCVLFSALRKFSQLVGRVSFVLCCHNAWCSALQAVKRQLFFLFVLDFNFFFAKINFFFFFFFLLL